jgi:hypothetical protein
MPKSIVLEDLLGTTVTNLPAVVNRKVSRLLTAKRYDFAIIAKSESGLDVWGGWGPDREVTKESVVFYMGSI